MTEIKFSKHNISSTDISLLNKSIKSGWLTHGKYAHEFENELCKFTKAKYAVLVSSCTAGIHISCIAAGFKKGDEVIVPAMTHTATAHAVEYTGARAVFCDVDKVTGNIDPIDLKKRLTRKTRGVIVVHLTGYPCNLKEIKKIVNKKKLTLIEDCAHSLGTKYQKKHVGNFGVSGCFSFYPTKQITTGEGGAVVTNDKSFYKKIKMLKAFGIDKDISERKKQGEYDVKDLGFNYRLTDFQALLGFRQIKKYNKNLKIRKKLSKIYIGCFSKCKKIVFPNFKFDNSFFIFPILVANRDKLLKFLKKKKIGVSVHYNKILPLMKYYKKKYKLSKNSYPNAYSYSQKNISLPIYPKLKKNEILRICKLINKFLNKS
jgi:dTDP-4-amino-4,6-dideoxygalactose transaminase